MTGENRKFNAQVELDKARAALRAARALADLGLWDDAVSRAYYAAFHAANALLLSEGILARTHAGTHDLLFQNFVVPGIVERAVSKDLAALQRYREQADYSSSIRFDATTGGEEVSRAERVVVTLSPLLIARGCSDESSGPG
jgi:uncharacterized protein (UPF0332 family)